MANNVDVYGLYQQYIGSVLACPDMEMFEGTVVRSNEKSITIIPRAKKYDRRIVRGNISFWQIPKSQLSTFKAFDNDVCLYAEQLTYRLTRLPNIDLFHALRVASNEHREQLLKTQPSHDEQTATLHSHFDTLSQLMEQMKLELK